MLVGGLGLGLGRTATGAGADADDAASVAALANSPAEENLAAGCFAIPRAMTSSKARPTPRRMMLGRGGGENMCALSSCGSSAHSKGG